MSYASSILASKYQPDYAQANMKVNIPTRFVRLEKRRPREEKQDSQPGSSMTTNTG
jgi:hypothetical protein